MATDLNQIEESLWKTADQMWANTGLRPSEYAAPVLGLIFLRYAEKRFVETELRLQSEIPKNSHHPIGKAFFQQYGVTYLSENARYEKLLTLPEDQNLGKALDEAMSAIEADNHELQGVLPRSYQAIPKQVLTEMLRLLKPLEIDGDAFGHIYEYFMGILRCGRCKKGENFIRLLVWCA